MIALKWLALWWLFGAAVQLAMMLHLRHKYGSYVADATIRIVLGRTWLLKMVTSCFFWPLGVYVWFFGKPTREQYSQEIDAIAEHMENRCPDCGEPLELHTEHLENDYRRGPR